MIGINFVGGGGPGPAGGVTLAPAAIAGVVPQANYNNVTGSVGSANNLINNTGAATTVDLTFSGGGTYTSSGNAPAGADEALNTGFVYGTVTGTISEIPFTTYDVYVYLENDAGGRATTTLLNGANARTNTSIAGSSAGQVDGNAGTPFSYLLASSLGAFPNANYALFTGVSGSSFTFLTSAPGNGSISGIQIVDTTVPEPASIVGWSLAGLTLGFAAFYSKRRKK